MEESCSENKYNEKGGDIKEKVVIGKGIQVGV